MTTLFDAYVGAASAFCDAPLDENRQKQFIKFAQQLSKEVKSLSEDLDQILMTIMKMPLVESAAISGQLFRSLAMRACHTAFIRIRDWGVKMKSIVGEDFLNVAGLRNAAIFFRDRRDDAQRGSVAFLPQTTTQIDFLSNFVRQLETLSQGLDTVVTYVMPYFARATFNVKRALSNRDEIEETINNSLQLSNKPLRKLHLYFSEQLEMFH